MDEAGRVGKVKFVAHTVKTGKNTMFYCFRSGVQRPSRGSAKRLERSLGTNKIGVFCPAYMEVSRKEGIITVKYQTCHADHDIGIGRLSISSEERLFIGQQLASGVPVNALLDKIRNGATEFTPFTLLQAQDIRNIKKALNLFEGRMDANDFISTQMMVDKLRNRGDSNPILHFDTGAVDGSGFMLIFATRLQLELLAELSHNGDICMDATHDTAGYGYLMASIVLPDAFGRGIATAFCLSSKGSHVEWGKFLRVVKESVAKLKGLPTFEFKVRVLMTDMDNSFYLAWKEVCGDVQHLYCAFHVDRAWRENLGLVSILILISGYLYCVLIVSTLTFLDT